MVYFDVHLQSLRNIVQPHYSLTTTWFSWRRVRRIKDCWLLFPPMTIS